MIELGEDTVRCLVEALQAMPPSAVVQVLTNDPADPALTISGVLETVDGTVELWTR